MTLARTGDLVRAAAQRGAAVGAFNVITLEHAEAVAAGAEAAGVAVVLQISQNAVAFHSGRLRPLASASLAVAEQAAVPVAVHLDHVEDRALLEAAVDCGIGSVMFDAGSCPYEENVALTRDAASWAHARGLWVEAELGYVGGKPSQPSRAHAAGVRTDPDEAAAFVAGTGVDALAVAVGSSHAMRTRSASLDHGLIRRLRDAVAVPLVLHGSSGVPDCELRAAVAAGIVKVNIGTALNTAMTAATRRLLGADPDLVDPRAYLSGARDAMAGTVETLARLVSAEQATGRSDSQSRR